MLVRMELLVCKAGTSFPSVYTFGCFELDGSLVPMEATALLRRAKTASSSILWLRQMQAIYRYIFTCSAYRAVFEFGMVLMTFVHIAVEDTTVVLRQTLKSTDPIWLLR